MSGILFGERGAMCQGRVFQEQEISMGLEPEEEEIGGEKGF